MHGWDGSPREPLLAWLKTQLEKRGYAVIAPVMPNPETPRINAWVGKLQEAVHPDAHTVLVGHSIGCQAILRYLANLKQETKIAGIILIAPWMHLDRHTLAEEGQAVAEIARPWMETPIDFKKIASHIRKAVCIFSDNDPYVPLGERQRFQSELAADIIVENNKGHFSPEDGVSELPSALAAVIGL